MLHFADLNQQKMDCDSFLLSFDKKKQNQNLKTFHSSNLHINHEQSANVEFFFGKIKNENH